MNKITDSKIHFMKKMICLFISLTTFYSLPVNAQKLMNITSIIDSIKTGNPSFKMYDADIR